LALKKIIELVKSDEEFRLALASAIGYYELLDEIRRLCREFNNMYMEFNRRFEEINKRFEVIEKKLLEHDKRLAGIELELGALTESFYSKTLWDDLREEIRRGGGKIILRKRNYRINESDIDLFIETNKKIYVVEVKVKPKHDDVGVLLVKIDLVKKRYPEKEVVGIRAGTMIGSEVEEYTREKNIKVYTY
jgi:hypothetical protein